MRNKPKEAIITTCKKWIDLRIAAQYEWLGFKYKLNDNSGNEYKAKFSDVILLDWNEKLSTGFNGDEIVELGVLENEKLYIRPVMTSEQYDSLHKASSKLLDMEHYMTTKDEHLSSASSDVKYYYYNIDEKQ